MDRTLYETIMDGKCIDDLERYQDQLDTQVTINKNTILHVAAQFGNTQCVKEILGMGSIGRRLCHEGNEKQETALHIAAREGNSDIIREIIDSAKTVDEDLESGVGVEVAQQILRMTNKDGDTALHEAVRNHHLEVVKLLVREDPEFSHAPNNVGETPLYLAAEKNLHECLYEILKTCKSPSYIGPGDRTALHATVINDCKECTQEILDGMTSLVKEVDAYGWTPLHYAARFGRVQRTIQLLAKDKTLAYVTADKDENKTALHVAASEGHIDVMEEILSQCPDCWEMTDVRGRNILHIAVEAERNEEIKYILAKTWSKGLINQKDVDGNTPLHLYAASDCGVLHELTGHPRVDLMAFNKKNLTAREVFTNIDFHRWNEGAMEKELLRAPWSLRNIISEDEEIRATLKRERVEDKKRLRLDLMKVANTQLIVAALIATVTFTAGFTVPGGLDGNVGPDQGMAVLSRKVAYKAFVIADVIAMISSMAAVIIHFLMSANEDQGDFIYRIVRAILFTFVALLATMVAFITGMYVVLPPSSGLAITVCVIGGVSLPLFFYLFHKKYFIYSIRNILPICSNLTF